jgi:sugar transferase (PEP-CTERM/EpsH1 system associated)
MKILFVCHRLPYPPNRGGKIRPFNMIKHLAGTHSVVVASLAHTVKELQEGTPLKQYCEDVICEVLPDSARWTRAVAALTTSRPSSVAYFWSPALYSRIAKAISQTKFDLIFVHCAFVAQYVPHASGSYQILDYGDIDSVKWAEYARFRRLPLSLGYGIEARKLNRYEREAAGRFHRCTVTTRGEKEGFDRLGVSTPCSVIPNGVDRNYFSPVGTIRQTKPLIVFLGRMDYFPNIDAVQYFVKEIFPRIRAKAPNAEFRIVGSTPPRSIQELARIPGVVVTGHVPDVRPHLTEAAVSVAPLRIARGTQNKILESMAMHIPVVATPEAAKGILAVPDRDLLMAEDATTFSTQVLNLLQNAGLRERLADAARRQLETAHHWPNSMSLLDDLLNEIPARAAEKVYS